MRNNEQIQIIYKVWIQGESYVLGRRDLQFPRSRVQVTITENQASSFRSNNPASTKEKKAPQIFTLFHSLCKIVTIYL